MKLHPYHRPFRPPSSAKPLVVCQSPTVIPAAAPGSSTGQRHGAAAPVAQRMQSSSLVLRSKISGTFYSPRWSSLLLICQAG